MKDPQDQPQLSMREAGAIILACVQEAVRAPYIFDRPMPVDKIVPGAFVYVPVWHRGEVIRWDNATVIGTWSTWEPSWIVQFPDGTEAGYFAYSVGCGVCMGRDDVTCHQCK